MRWWNHEALKAEREKRYSSILKMHKASRLGKDTIGKKASGLGKDTIEKIESAPTSKNQPTFASIAKYCEVLKVPLADFVVAPNASPVEILVPGTVDFRARLHPWRNDESWMHSRLMLSVLSVGIRSLPSAVSALQISHVTLTVERVGKRARSLQKGTVFHGKWLTSITRANGRNSAGSDNRDSTDVWLGLLDRSAAKSDFDAVTIQPGGEFVHHMLFDAQDSSPEWTSFIKDYAVDRGDIELRLALRYRSGARTGGSSLLFVVPGAVVASQIERCRAALKSRWDDYRLSRDADGPVDHDIEQRRVQFRSAHPSFIQPPVLGGRYAD